MSVGSCSLPLPKGVLLHRREPGVQLRRDGPWWNRHHGLRGESVLRPWCGCDGGIWCPHVAPPGDGVAGAPLSARGCVELIGGVLEDGTQQW
jgi:hypothetical protein